MSNKKRVLHLSHTDIRTDSRILKELRALASTGHYDLLAIGIDSRDLRRGATLECVDIKSIDLLFTRSKWRPSIIRYFLAFFELILKALYLSLTSGRVDIVHCHDSLLMPVAWLAAKFNRAKLVYDAHELESEKNSQSIINSKLNVLLEKFVWSRINLFITVSPSIQMWYEEKYGHKDSVLVLNSPEYDSTEEVSGIEIERTNYLRDAFRIPADKKIFIYVGMLMPGRGIENVLAVFKSQAINSHVVFLGYGVLEEEIRRAASGSVNIHLHEAVPHTKVVSIVQNADVGLCFIERISLSDYYCLPNKLFEYAFSKLPVLASRFPDMEAVINEHQLGVCVDESAESIRVEVERVESEGVHFKHINLESLSWQAQADRLVGAYRRL